MAKEILALDFGATFGYCSGPLHHGFEKLTDDGRQQKLYAFFKWLKLQLTNTKYGAIAYEHPTGRNQPSTISMHAGYEAAVMILCEAYGLDRLEVWPATLKKYITGMGHASKEAVAAALNEKYPEFEFEDDNQADAIAVWIWANDPEAQVEEARRIKVNKQKRLEKRRRQQERKNHGKK